MIGLGNVTCTPSTPSKAWVGRFLLKKCILPCIHNFFASILPFLVFRIFAGLFTMNPEVTRELTYILMIELLA
jgi:hypothetical protein